MPRTRSIQRALALLGGSAALAVLAACAPGPTDSDRIETDANPIYPALTTDPDVPVIEDIIYSQRDGQLQFLDACFPGDSPVVAPDTAPRASIIVVHGGSWRRGEKDNLNWRAVCQWLARSGYVTVSIDYRLAPQWTFPAQLQDVQDAVRWLRDPDVVDRYHLDPERIGAFGGSAGGNLVSLLGTAGSGDRTDGVRVAAVAELSGPADLTAPIVTTGGNDVDFPAVMLEFLGCPTFDGCPTAAQASPATAADETDPPFFVGHSLQEYIPLSQSERFAAALRDAGIDVTFVTVEGDAHSIAMLDDEMAGRILEFFARTLAPPLPDPEDLEAAGDDSAG